MGLSYFKPGPDGYNLSLHALYNINSENEDTKYRSGDQLFLNWAATKSFGGFNAGFVGYYTKQTTADTETGIIINRRFQAFPSSMSLSSRRGLAWVRLSAGRSGQPYGIFHI